jgi:hypothetical protein
MSDDGAQTGSFMTRVRRAIPAPVKRLIKGESAADGAAIASAHGGHEDPMYRLLVRSACQAGAMQGPGFDEASLEFEGIRYKFFFLCGCYKSGTNWLGALLNLHPHIKCRGEFHFQIVAKAMEHFTTRSWYVAAKPWLTPYADESFRAMVRTMIFCSLRDKPEARVLGDRTPRPLEALLPGAPHLYIYRDGRDVLVSWAYHWMRTGGPNLFLPGFKDLTIRTCEEFKADPAKFKNNPSAGFLGNDEWVRQTCRDWADRMKNDFEAAEQLPKEGTPVHVVRYEDLHMRFDELRPKIYEFLGEDPALAAAPSEETKTLPGFSKENPASKHRKGVIGDWRNYFDERLTRIFKEEAGEQLIKLNYEQNNDWVNDDRD